MSPKQTNMKLSKRLTIGFGSAVVLGMTIAGVGGWRMHDLANQINQIANDRMVKSHQLGKFKDNLNAVAQFARNILLSQDAAFTASEKKRMAELRASNDELLATLDKTILLPQGRALLKVIADARPGYVKLVDEAIALDAQGDKAGAAKLLLGQALAQQQILFKAADDSILLQQQLSKDLAQEAEDSATATAWLLGILALSMAVLGVVINAMLSRGLSRSLGAEPAELSAVAQRVTAGDLQPIEGATHAPAGSVLASLAEMQASLARIVGHVRQSSDSIATGSAQIAAGNADLSRRTEDQASNLEQTAASMEQLSGTVRANAETAHQANQMATQASAAAVKGGQVVGTVVTTMHNIAASSRKISDIIGVIDGIAFQTNILALNAAVEAARAGEQGRGFAVVASEVRSLAGRSAEAAKEIKSLIGASVQQVEVGARQVNEAGASMDEIVAEIQRVTQLIGAISNATAEQSTGIGQVGEAVTMLDRVTQQNAALVEQSAAAAESLRNQATQLAQAVSVFKLGSGDHGTPATSEPARARASTTHATPAARPVSRPAKSTPAPQVTSAAPTPAPRSTQTATAEDTENWETF